MIGDFAVKTVCRECKIHTNKPHRTHGVQCLEWQLEDEREAVHAITLTNERLKRVFQQCLDVIEDNLEERAPRHSLGRLCAELKTLVKTKESHEG